MRPPLTHPVAAPFVTRAPQGIINELIDAKDMTGSQVQEITSQIPDDILQQVKEFLPLFRIAVVLPGVLAALLLTVVSLCGLYGGKSFCCTKLIIFPLCYVALVVCIVFYFIFFTLALLMFVPQAQEQLRRVRLAPPVSPRRAADSKQKLDARVRVCDLRRVWQSATRACLFCSRLSTMLRSLSRRSTRSPRARSQRPISRLFKTPTTRAYRRQACSRGCAGTQER